MRMKEGEEGGVKKVKVKKVNVKVKREIRCENGTLSLC